MDAGVTQSKGKEFVEYLVFILVVRTQSLEAGLDYNPQQPPLRTRHCQLRTTCSTNRASGGNQVLRDMRMRCVPHAKHVHI